MKNGTVALAIALLVLAVPATARTEELARCHILVGGPHTSLLSLLEAGVEGVDGCWFDVAGAQAVSTATTDNSGLGFDLDLYFFDANGNYVAACATEAADESCTTPAGAAVAEVVAFVGVDLDVVVHGEYPDE